MSKNGMPGRPSTYSDEIANEICRRLAEGEPLAMICRDAHLPAYTTVMRWRGERDEFREMYARAREDQGDTLADRINELAEQVVRGEVDPHAGRVAIDALKWSASKLRPQAYSDRMQVSHSATLNLAPIDEAPEWLTALLAEKRQS